MPSLYIFTNLNYSKITELWKVQHKLNKVMLASYEKSWRHCTGQSLHMETMPTPSFSLPRGKGQSPRRVLPSVIAHAHCFSWLSSGESCGGTSCWILGCPCFWLETLYSTVETVEAWRRKCTVNEKKKKIYKNAHPRILTIYQAVINIKCHFLAPELQFSLKRSKKQRNLVFPELQRQ